MKRLPVFTAILIAVIAMLGSIGGLYYTRYGPGLASDSVAYIQGALNLKEGYGYARFSGDDTRVPITGFPPLYSMVLSVAGLVCADLFQGGRWLNAILFAFNIGLSGWLVFTYSRSAWFAALGSLSALVFWGMVLSHAWLMSEGLFIFWLLLSLLLFSCYFKRGKRLWLALTGLSVALAILTRYAGLSLAITVLLALILFWRDSWKRRLVDALLFGGISLLPVMLWIIRNMTLAQTMTNRVVSYYTISYELIAAYMHEWTTWLFPAPFNLPWRPRVLLTFSIVLILMVLFVISQFRRSSYIKTQGQAHGTILPQVLLIFIPAYIAVVLLNNVFLDATSSISAIRRFLLPVYITLAIAILCMVYYLAWERMPRIWLKMVVLVYILVIILFHGAGSLSNLRSTELDLGLTNARRFWGDVVSGLRAIESSRSLISDNPQLLYVLCGRTAYRAPVLYNRFTAQYEQDFGMKLDEMRQRIDQGAILVLFQRYADDVQSVPESENYTQKITQDLTKLKNYSHATFYVSPNAP